MNETASRRPISQILSTLRHAAKLTQSDVARHLGLDRSAYAYYETGVTSPNLENLAILAELFGVSCDYLLGRTTAKEVDSTLGNAIADGAPAPVSKLAHFSKEERELLLWYRQLTDEEKPRLIEALSTHCLEHGDL